MACERRVHCRYLGSSGFDAWPPAGCFTFANRSGEDSANAVNPAMAALESVAAQCGKMDTAIDANPGRAKVRQRLCGECRCCILLNETKSVWISSSLQNARCQRPTGCLDSLCRLRSSPRIALFVPEAAGAWEARLDATPELAPHRALLDYFRATSQNLLAKDEALSRLEEHYQALGRPLLIAIRLFHELDATDSAQAKHCIGLAPDLQSNQMLDLNSALHLAQAFVTRHKWQAAFDLSQESFFDSTVTNASSRQSPRP